MSDVLTSLLERTIELKIQVNAYDIDAGGHVNNIVYVRWLEDLRTGLMKEIFDFKKIMTEGCYVVVTSTSIRYKKEIKLFDRPVGRMKVVEISHGMLVLRAEIEANGFLCASAEQRCVIMRLSDSRILKMDEIRNFVIL